MLSTLAVLLALTPQGGARCSGAVVDAGGKPVAGAAVTLLSRTIPRVLEVGSEDRRTARTDERGRFRIEVEPSSRYTAWASDRDGATDFVEGVGAGEFFELRMAAGTDPSSFELRGADAWPEAAEFALRTIVGGEHIDFVTLHRDGNRVQLPALPRLSMRVIEVLATSGEVLWSSALRGTGDERTLTLPPPTQLRVQVSDQHGAPIAGAEVRWHIHNYYYSESGVLPWLDRFRAPWPVVGTSGADGSATLRIPDQSGGRDVWLLTQKPGLGMSLDGFQRGARFENGQVLPNEDTPKDAPIDVTLQQAAPVTLDLQAADGTALAEQFVYLGCRVRVRRKNGGYGTILTWVVPVRAGSASMPSPLPKGTVVELAEVVLAASTHQALTEQHGFAPRRVWRLPDTDQLLQVPPAKPSLDPTTQCRLQVTATDGRPAAHAIVIVTDQDGKARARLRTDRLGRVLVPTDEDGRIAVLGARGFGTAALPEDGDAPLQVQLTEAVPLRIRVVDQHNQPVTGAHIGITQLSHDEQIGDDPVGLAWAAAITLPLQMQGTTDADGITWLLAPPHECVIQLNGTPRPSKGVEVYWQPQAEAARAAAAGNEAAAHTVTVTSTR